MKIMLALIIATLVVIGFILMPKVTLIVAIILLLISAIYTILDTILQ